MMVSAFSEDSEQGQAMGAQMEPSGGNRPVDSADADAGKSSTADYESGG